MTESQEPPGGILSLNFKKALGYVFEPDKFGRAGMSAVPFDTVGPFRVLECPIQLEGVLGIGDDSDKHRGHLNAIEVEIQRVHVHPDLLMEGHAN